MKFSQKEAALCVGGGLAASLVIFAIAFFVQPTIITKEGFWLPAGMLPMILITIIYGRRKEARKKDEEEQ